MCEKFHQVIKAHRKKFLELPFIELSICHKVIISFLLILKCLYAIIIGSVVYMQVTVDPIKSTGSLGLDL